MISTREELDACLGVAPAAVGLKVIDHLDSEANRWLAAATLAFVSVAQKDGVNATIAGGSLGFARALDPRTLAVPVASLDDPQFLAPDSGVAFLTLVPGIGETLRVNGRVAVRGESEIEIAVDEVYVHCAKALIRSAFWAASPRTATTDDPTAFLRDVRFVAIATADSEGNADMSPKGDPAGTMLHWTGAHASYAERPGNRRKDSLKNLLERPHLAALALIPGSNTVVTLDGRARLDDTEAARAPFTVEGKRPKLVTVIEDARVALRESPALARAALWPVVTSEHGIDPAAMLTAHVKRNKTSGFAAGLMRRVLSKRMMGAGLAHDYEKRLY